jgi:hypothetical protein
VTLEYQLPEPLSVAPEMLLSGVGLPLTDSNDRRDGEADR